MLLLLLFLKISLDIRSLLFFPLKHFSMNPKILPRKISIFKQSPPQKKNPVCLQNIFRRWIDWLFVYCFTYCSRICTCVQISPLQVKGRKMYAYDWRSGTLSRERSLLSRIHCDAGSPFSRRIWRLTVPFSYNCEIVALRSKQIFPKSYDFAANTAASMTHKGMIPWGSGWKLDPLYPHACRKRRLIKAVLWMRPERPRSCGMIKKGPECWA